MKRKAVFMITFILLFSAIFNTGSGGILTVNAASDGPELKRSNIEDGDRDVYVDEIFVLTFDRDIREGPGEIELYNWDRSKREKVKFDIYGDTLEITPSSDMEYYSDYELTLEKDSIVTDDRYEDPMAKRISISFITEKDSKDRDDDDSDYGGKTYGARLGEIEGQIAGYMDSVNDKKNDWDRAILSDKRLTDTYNLNRETAEYRRAFLNDYKNKFREAYQKAYRAEKFEGTLDIKENALVHGRGIGMLEGEAQGEIDYISGKKNNWEQSLPSDAEIIEKYNLKREDTEYRDSFLTEYKESFRKAYNSAFWGRNLEIAVGNLSVDYVSMSGGEVDSYDDAVKLKIEPGSFYEETGISIERVESYDSFFGTGITFATDSYNIRVQNSFNSVALKKPITIEFAYYGPKEGAIHEFRNGRWQYLYSKIKDNKISADISSSLYSGGTYAVLINEGYETVDDVGGHWAVQSIETFLRRNHISGYPDKTFRPEQSITRAEFVKILDSVYGWDRRLPLVYTSTYFADSSIFGVFANSISRATSLGYVQGYGDNTFRPHIPINYQEIEWLMQRVTGRYNFNWNTVAEKILNDYYVRSKGYSDKQNYITRAEVVYLLYSLEEGLI